MADTFGELLAFAQESDDVVGLFLFGSRAGDGFADESSDHDVAVVMRDEATARFGERWPYVHGADVEIVCFTLDELRAHGEYFTDSQWARPLYAHVDLRVDKGREIAPILRSKQSVPADARDRIVWEGLDGYVNSTYRALRYAQVGAGAGVRLDRSRVDPAAPERALHARRAGAAVQQAPRARRARAWLRRDDRRLGARPRVAPRRRAVPRRAVGSRRWRS